MDRKTLIAIALCIFFYMGYNHYLQTKYPDMGKPVPTATEEQKAAAPSTGAGEPTQTGQTTPTGQPSQLAQAEGQTPAKPAETIKQLSSEELTIRTDTSVYKFSQEFGSIKSIKLNGYNETNEPDSPPMDIVDGNLTVQGVIDSTRTIPLQGIYHAERNGSTIKFWRTTPTWRIAHEFKIAKSGYGADVDVTFTNIGNKAVDLTGGVLLRETVKYAVAKQSFLMPAFAAGRPSFIHSFSDDTEWEDAEEYCGEDSATAVSGTNQNVNYIGFDKHYFLKAFIPKTDKLSYQMKKVGTATDSSCPLAVTAFQTYGMIYPAQSTVMSYSAYFGPKEISIMEGFNPTLKTSIDLGIFDFIAQPLLIAIKWFYSVIGNYGIAIIILTLLMKILFYPLMKASATSMFKMKKLNPQMTAIREKHKDDKQKQQQELMKFMSANQINPAKGCLPILPQIPVFFAFYQVLRTSVELRHAPFFGWIQDLSAMDPYYVTPVLMGIGMFFQQKLTPTTGMDKTQEKIMMMLPLVFTVMMLTLPSGMVLYMLTNIVTSIAQQQYLNRKLERLSSNK